MLKLLLYEVTLPPRLRAPMPPTKLPLFAASQSKPEIDGGLEANRKCVVRLKICPGVRCTLKGDGSVSTVPVAGEVCQRSDLGCAVLTCGVSLLVPPVPVEAAAAAASMTSCILSSLLLFPT